MRGKSNARAWRIAVPEGYEIGRPKKNRDLLIGRAGRNAIEHEDLSRDARRWQRRKETIERLSGENVETNYD